MALSGSGTDTAVIVSGAGPRVFAPDRHGRVARSASIATSGTAMLAARASPPSDRSLGDRPGRRSGGKDLIARRRMPAEGTSGSHGGPPGRARSKDLNFRPRTLQSAASPVNFKSLRVEGLAGLGGVNRVSPPSPLLCFRRGHRTFRPDLRTSFALPESGGGPSFGGGAGVLAGLERHGS